MPFKLFSSFLVYHFSPSHVVIAEGGASFSPQPGGVPQSPHRSQSCPRHFHLQRHLLSHHECEVLPGGPEVQVVHGPHR